MLTGWIEGMKLPGPNGTVFTVEKHPIGRPGGKPLRQFTTPPKRLVQHTAELPTINMLINALSVGFDPSHVGIGSGRIVQFRPFDFQAAALRQNPGPLTNARCIQIEAVGYAQTHLWQFDDWTDPNKPYDFPINKATGRPVATRADFKGSTLEPLVAFYAFLMRDGQIPMVRPNPNWKEDCSDIKTILATNNTRRKDGTWIGNATGIFGHLEVVNQQPTWHFDPGKLMYGDLIARAQAVNDSLKT